MQKVKFFLCLSLISFSIFAQKEVEISGKVLDKETGQPLEYATVSFFNKSLNKIETGGITDLDGNFNIPVNIGVYDISIEYISFKTITIPDKNITTSENIGTFNLELDTETLEAVEIIAEKTTVEVRLDKKIYNVGKDLTVSGGTVSDVLDNVPSVSVDAEGTVALRGNDNVRILINGKPSGLVGLNSAEALQQLPAEAIEKVEVVTSPSARYEAEGTAGILNIILRRSKLQGLNGSVTTNIGHPETYGINGNINYRTGNINIFNTTAYNDRERLGKWYNDVSYFDINTPDLNERRNWTDNRKGVTTNTGIEWYINDSASLIGSVVYRNSDNLNNSVNTLTQFNKINNTISESFRLDPEKEDNKTIQYALNFTKNFEKTDHKLTADFQYEDSDANINSLINVNGIDSEIVNTLEDQQNILLQTDYVVPIGKKSQFEIGYRGDFTTRSTDFEVSFLNPNSGAFEINRNLTNVFNFKQYITAAYTQFGSKIGNFSYLLGLRMENTRITLDQPTTGDFNRKKIDGLFPTVNFNYEVSETQSFSLGYNRRIRRPRGFMLNPFPSRSSVTNVFQGNPDLNPTFAGTFELGYLNRLNKVTISSSIYYASSKDIMTFVSRRTGQTVIVDGEEFPVIERGPVNLGEDRRYGFEFNLNYSPSRKWRVNTDFNIFRFEREGTFEGIDLSADNLTWTARINNKITLPYAIDWQTNISYRGPSQDAQNNRRGVFGTNVALSKDLFKEKASIAFNVQDVFNSRFYRNDINAETFTAYQEIQFRGGRIYNLAFTYRFNQKKKPERQRDFDSEGMEM
ncbi:Outer membrane receptor proteins, mostly Fe transport [Hyunsoonleella jejuensis]|uniref:Outer membrane receptor proteins, mostly Fe transport n=1 Tax=Hyunsoonleella jejuensis TaxID=419940 RepID=A0A1H9GCT2_9FLAO|nr:TonB-dependent receptor [Hyunsoonleella jejuensis]SEQ47578.1 Outer membrane receptor proteins, mostly Fe transport [Hyunsoonleella jejuensis]